MIDGKVHVCLAMMANCTPETLMRAVNSARHMVYSMCLVVAPGDPLYDFEPGLPGKVVDLPWQGFALTRTATLRAAEEDESVDWVLMLDADDVFSRSSKLPDLGFADRMGVDAYQIPIDVRGPGWRWRWSRNGHLMRARCGFSWAGTGESDRHEVMMNPERRFISRYDGLVVSNVYDPKAEEAAKIIAEKSADVQPARAKAGGRTYLDDVESLSKRRTDLPLDSRAAFYLAQSLKDAGRWQEAFDAFSYRARMIGGFDEETFWAYLWLAKLADRVGRDPVELYHQAHQHSPKRAEPLRALEWIFRHRGNQDLAYLYAMKANACRYPVDAQLFVECHTYHHDKLQEAGIDP